MKLVGVVAVPLVMVGSLFGLIVLLGTTPSADASTFCIVETGGNAESFSFDDEQLANAATIIKVGQSRNVPSSGLVVAIAAALQESSLHNLPDGDRDSAGLFQMRPSTGWGSVEQVTDPTYAATAFFGGQDEPPANAGLLDISGWEQMSITEAAQAVEASAYPGAYAKWGDDAAALVHKVTGESFECGSSAGANCPEPNLPVEAGLTPDAQLVVRCAVSQFHIQSIGGLATSGHSNGSDHYTGRAVDLMIDDWTTADGVQFGDQVSTYFVSNAKGFGVTYIIWRARIWTTERPYWRPYSHPDGRTDPTALHMDHLHISVSGNDATTTKEPSS